jgi:hypothetical protein
LSRFSRERNIPYVIPVSRSNEPFNNPNVYQVNPPQSNQYSKAASAFSSRYNRENIILVSDVPGASNRKDFIDLLKQELQDRRIPYKTVAPGATFANDIQAMLSANQKNVIVPSDDTAETLSRLIVSLRAVVEAHPGMSFSLFGYPDWQAHSARFTDDFFRFNTTFYTFFYSDPASPDARAFHGAFYRYFSKLLENTFPKFGMIGYDTGMYFIRLIHAHGTQFDSRINSLRYTGVQTDFYFERLNNWSGFINTNMYLINYNSDYSITKNIIR